MIDVRRMCHGVTADGQKHADNLLCSRHGLWPAFGVPDLPDIAVAAQTLDVRQEFVQNIGTDSLVDGWVESLNKFIERASLETSMTISAILIGVDAQIREFMMLAAIIRFFLFVAPTA